MESFGDFLSGLFLWKLEKGELIVGEEILQKKLVLSSTGEVEISMDWRNNREKILGERILYRDLGNERSGNWIRSRHGEGE